MNTSILFSDGPSSPVAIDVDTFNDLPLKQR